MQLLGLFEVMLLPALVLLTFTPTQTEHVLFAYSSNSTVVQDVLMQEQGCVVVDLRKDLEVLKQLPKFEKHVLVVDKVGDYLRFVSSFYRKSGFNPRGIFLIYYFGGEALEELFKVSWKYYLLDVTVVDANMKGFTYHPVQEGVCGSTQPVSVDNWKVLKKQGVMKQYLGCPVRVLPLPIQPYVIDVSDSSNPGFEVVMLLTLAERLNFTVSFMENNFKHWGYKLKDNTYTAMMSELTGGKVDLLIGMVISNHSLEDDFDNVNAVVDCSLNFFVPIALPIDSWKNFTAIFTGATWVLILASTMAMMVTWWGCERKGFATSALEVWGGLFGNINAAPTALKFRSVVLLWLLFSFLISSTYQGSLTSFLTKSVYEHQISDLEELINSDLSYGGYPALRLQFNETGNQVFKELYSNWVDCDLTEKCINRTAEERDFGVLKNNRQLDYLMPKYSFEGGKPKIFMIKKSIRPGMICHTFEKGFPLFEAYGEVVLRLHEGGLVGKWIRDVARAPVSVEESSFSPLEVKDLKVAYVVLGIGHGMAFLAFLAEVVSWRFSQKRKDETIRTCLNQDRSASNQTVVSIT